MGDHRFVIAVKVLVAGCGKHPVILFRAFITEDL
jgi:hypothetical protein